MLELNRVFLVGNLTRDPEVRYVPSGKAVSDFDLAVSRRFRDRAGEQRQETLFIKVESWGKLAEFCGEYLKKGRRILLEGRLKNEVWEGRDGLRRERITVVADRIQFADLKPSAPPEEAAEEEEQMAGEAEAETHTEPASEPPPSMGMDEDKLEEDLPF